MKNFIQSLFIIGLIFNICINFGATHFPASKPGTFQECSDVWGVVSKYSDVSTQMNLTRVSRTVGAEPREQLVELRQWIANGGLLISLFGAPSEQDRENLRRLPQWDRGVDQYTFDDYKRLITGFVHLKLDPERTNDLSSKMNETIERIEALSSSEKELLKQYTPEKTPEQLSESFGRRISINPCCCDARFLEKQNEQIEKCVCYVELMDSDLRRITPRILVVAHQFKGSNTLIKLYFAHIELKITSIFWPMKYQKPELRMALISKLKEELVAEKFKGSDLIKCISLFSLLGSWDGVDHASKLLIEQASSLKEYLIVKGFMAIHKNVIIPMVRIGRLVCWLALKAGIVKK